MMPPPSNYIGFAEYLGLNDEAGQQMLAKTMQPGMKLRDEAMAATDARFQAAKGGAESYAASGERERKGLASYGEFMAGLNDPAKRQALMEKVYGKGAVSTLDSALVGSTGAQQLAAGVKDVGRLQHRAEEAGMRNEQRAGAYDKQAAGYAQQAKDYAAAQAGKRAELAKVRAENADREDWRAWNAEEWKRSGYGSDPLVNRSQNFMGRGVDPVTGKKMTFQKWKQSGSSPAYGWGGAGTLRDASGGGDY